MKILTANFNKPMQVKPHYIAMSMDSLQKCESFQITDDVIQSLPLLVEKEILHQNLETRLNV